MKTDLNSGSTLFKKSRNPAGQAPGPATIEKSTKDETMVLDELVDRINLAIEEKDVDALPWLQLEIQTRSLIMLRMIDWKMWEIYNKFVKN